ncbi:hypothetical protein CBL_09769 [Carabus blaptoides fortunei]
MVSGEAGPVQSVIDTGRVVYTIVVWGTAGDESPMPLRYAWSGKLVTSPSADKDGASDGRPWPDKDAYMCGWTEIEWCARNRKPTRNAVTEMGVYTPEKNQ